ncbi:transcriptional regulator [Lactiplantibacillus pentosus]|nr:transcriptional regulator [Lactiplantibacillus pentosus]MCE6029787.1 TetR/AcrR family transcriptional regulator [Lactiplantibacillus pentosus]MCT3278287.1 TetR/AcrR family transcriptional regulator [Lactiplantibacillus pentosus]
MKAKKIDRRTLFTRQAIKDAFITLVKQDSYAHITVTALCREAEITRSTFYLHYDSITAVLNEVLDEALQLPTQHEPSELDTQLGFDYLKENESLIPACQRIGDSDKYQELLMDPDLSDYIVGHIMAHERERVIPALQQKTGLSREDTETLFLYMIHGSFAVNRAHKFVKDPKWSHDVQLLNRFTNAGYKTFKD